MKAKDWMSTTVYTCRPETSMNEAAYLMWEKDCGVLPVVDAGGRLVGIVTDRDLCMSACLRGAALKDLKVEQAMNRTVFTCGPEDTIEAVVRQMGDHQVRRIPVIDAERRVRGLLSVNDLVRHLVALDDARAHAALAARLVEAQASICETRAGQPIELVPPRPTPRARSVPAG